MNLFIWLLVLIAAYIIVRHFPWKMDEVKWTRPWSPTSFTSMLLKECESYRLKVMYCTANDLSFLASYFERKIKTDMKKLNFESVWSVENTAYPAFILALCTNLSLCEINIFLIVSYLS